MNYLNKIKTFLRGLIKFISGWFSNLIIKENNKYQATLAEQVAQARLEWQNALLIFNEISEPELIDYAIYNLKAREEYYLYLTKLAQKKGIKNFTVVIM